MDTKGIVQGLRAAAGDATTTEQKDALSKAADAVEVAYYNDENFYRIVAVGLGVAVFAAVAAMFSLLASDHQQGLDGIAAIGSAAVAGLVAVFKRN